MKDSVYPIRVPMFLKETIDGKVRETSIRCGTKFVGGITKRELFAAMALQGILTSRPEEMTPIKLVSAAIEAADLLLSELNRSGE